MEGAHFTVVDDVVGSLCGITVRPVLRGKQGEWPIAVDELFERGWCPELVRPVAYEERRQLLMIPIVYHAPSRLEGRRWEGEFKRIGTGSLVDGVCGGLPCLYFGVLGIRCSVFETGVSGPEVGTI